jgi:2-amino-4-hydroxy-6-hydroxymethyldihydropteridine diphosphokinase
MASNRDQRNKLAKAREELCEILNGPSFTSQIWTEPINSRRSSALYLNQLVHGTYPGTMSELVTTLKQLEVKMGRTEQDRLLGIVEIDLDLMLYDHQRMHLSDWDRPYIQKLVHEMDLITHR